jgi:hypothetical protein
MSMSVDAAEASLGFAERQSHPAQLHVAATPALDVARCAADGADHVLDSVARARVEAAVTQFYLAYSFYRQGWHRTHHEDELYRQGLEHVERAIALSPGGGLVVDDADLGMRSADELRAELEEGLTRDASDFNPLRLLRVRK